MRIANNSAGAVWNHSLPGILEVNLIPMKKRLAFASILTGLILAGLPSAYGQSDKPVESEIRDITVFLARAQVTRTVKTRLEAGRTSLVIGGLASQLDPTSIQVAGKGNFLIMGTSHRQNFLQDVNMPKSLRVLKDSLEYYKRQLVVEEGQREILNKEEAMLVANQRIGGNNANLTVAELKSMADFFRTRLGDIVVSRMKQESSIRKTNEKIARVQTQINNQNELFSRNSSEIVVNVSADNATQAELEVSYVVSRAGWQPVYDLRAMNTKSPVQLNYRANVFQSTGEEWKNVKLTLSTANPNLGGLKPELAAQVLDFIQVMPYGGYERRMKSAAPVAMERAEDAPATMELDAATMADLVSTVESAITTSFIIAVPYTVASSTKPTMVEIGKHDLQASYQYAVAPKLDPDAFLIARATGWEDYNLLPGEASIFFEGTFVGKTYLDPQSIKDTLSVSLGRDKRIVVKREKVKDLTSRKAIGSNIRETRGYEISVRNARSEAIMIVVEDQVPVSRNNLIEVSVTDVGGASWNRDTGKLTWTWTLQPSESKKAGFKFEVKYPKDKTINGL
jgi:uncharacterized protein (TIGR02231 family)